MDKTTLEKRLAEITAGKEQSIANLNFIVGQENEVRHWLAQLSAVPTEIAGKKRRKKAEAEKLSTVE